MLEPQRFRKRPVEIEAMRFDGTHESYEAIARWSNLAVSSLITGILVHTKEGSMIASPGDWVIREPFPTDDRRFYPCKPDIFEATYEAVNG